MPGLKDLDRGDNIGRAPMIDAAPAQNLDLFWLYDEDGKGADLMVGRLPMSAATIRKAKAWWGVVFWLPEVRLRKEYMPPDDLKAAVEAEVRKFFEHAAMPSPYNTTEGT